MKSVAFRSLNAAAAKRADMKAKAAGNEALRLEARQLLMEEVTDVEVCRSYGMHEESDASLLGASLSFGEYGETSEYNEQHMAVAATMVAADLIKTGGFDAPAVYRKLDVFATTVSGRRRGFRGPHFLGPTP